jgi:serine/threonine-protein kinase RsbW
VVTAARSIRVGAELGALANVREFVRRAAADAAAPVDCLEDLVQAVDEAATNTIVHGYDGEPGWLEVSAGAEDGTFVVVLEDAAPEFDPTSCPQPDLTVPPRFRKPGGMGVHLMRRSTDAMTYRPRPGGGNILTLARSMQPGRKEEG